MKPWIEKDSEPQIFMVILTEDEKETDRYDVLVLSGVKIFRTGSREKAGRQEKINLVQKIELGIRGQKRVSKPLGFLARTVLENFIGYMHIQQHRLNDQIMKKATFLLLVLAVFFSCSEPEKEGDWDDNIGLSQKEVQFSGSENSIVITTKGEGWWIYDVSLNGNSNFEPTENSDGQFFIDEDEDEFMVERRSAKELHIEMSANTTGSERILIIGLQNGNYFDGIAITQSAE